MPFQCRDPVLTAHVFPHLTHKQEITQDYLTLQSSVDLTTHAQDFIPLFQNDLKQIIPLQEEALQAFIQPETLDGPNQYFCERCKKKCDARKVTVAKAGGTRVTIKDGHVLIFCLSLSSQGLRFLHFPYLLTLQLKRFDFDYTTMHRIKLNDRMTFPEELDMSPFIDVEDEVGDGEQWTPASVRFT